MTPPLPLDSYSVWVWSFCSLFCSQWREIRGESAESGFISRARTFETNLVNFPVYLDFPGVSVCLPLVLSFLSVCVINVGIRSSGLCWWWIEQIVEADTVETACSSSCGAEFIYPTVAFILHMTSFLYRWHRHINPSDFIRTSSQSLNPTLTFSVRTSVCLGVKGQWRVVCFLLSY